MTQESKLDSNSALEYLLHDYSKYHWVLVILGTISLVVLFLIARKYWKLFRTYRNSVERIASLFVSSFSSLIFFMMLLIVFGNFLNAMRPEAGFSDAIESLSSNTTSSKSVKISNAYSAWIESGDAILPSSIKRIVDERLSWQLPKAIVCSVLFALTLTATNRLWNYLIATGLIHSRKKQIALLISGVSLSLISTVLWIMALANTQASIAPVTISLLFS